MQGKEELMAVVAKVSELMRITLKALVHTDFCLAEKVVTEQPKIAAIIREFRQNHIHRLTVGIKETEDTCNLHLELLNGYQQISELIRNVDFTIMEELTQGRACLETEEGTVSPSYKK